MQPLISVDHESRHNSYRAEDEPRPSEQTPLLPRFPPPVPEDRNGSTTAVVTVLLVILIAGVVIGIYLLIVQNNSENILPPVETPLRLVSEAQWNLGRRPVLSTPSLRASRIVVVQTDTEQCHSTHSCQELLRKMQSNTTEQILPYNFLLSSNGLTFEALGWRRPSPLFPEYPSALVLAFIGNFTKSPPTRAQLEEARDFFAESVSLQHLDPSYSIVGKRCKETPKYLFKTLSKLPQWDKNLSDSNF